MADACGIEWSQCAAAYGAPHECDQTPNHDGLHLCGCGANDHRDRLGRRVREVWALWAMRHPTPKPSWLLPYDDLEEIDKEVDRCIGSALWGDGFAAGLEAGLVQAQLVSKVLMADKRQVRVIHMTGNTGWGGSNARIKPYPLKDGDRVVSASYWRASGNHEQLDIVIEEDMPDAE